MSEATKKLQALLEDGFEVSASFHKGVYTLRLRKGLVSSSAMLHIQKLRMSGSAELAQVFDLMRESFDEFDKECGQQEENHAATD